MRSKNTVGIHTSKSSLTTSSLISPSLSRFCKYTKYKAVNFIISFHLRQTLRRPKNPGCLGCATHNLPPLYRGVCIGTPPRQLSGPIVASFGLRHRDTPKFCVRVIFDIYLSFAYTQKNKGTETAPLEHHFGKRLPFAKRELFFP